MIEFGLRFRTKRLAIICFSGRPMSQEAAARLFNVSLSTVRGWEHHRSLPDERSRIAGLDDSLVVVVRDLFENLAINVCGWLAVLAVQLVFVQHLHAGDCDPLRWVIEIPV